MNITERNIKLHERRLAVMLAHERGEVVEMRSVGKQGLGYLPRPRPQWLPCPRPHWWWNTHDYRIKPKEPRKFTLAVNKRNGSVVWVAGNDLHDYPVDWEIIDVVEVPKDEQDC